MPKIAPTMKKFYFTWPVDKLNNGDLCFLDTAQILSLANKREYRQGMDYVIQNIEMITDGTATLGVYTLPTTWVGYNSWVMGMNLWREMNDQVLDDQPSLEPKYIDYKIHMDVTHQTEGFSNNLIPRGFALTATEGVYDWEPSTYFFPEQDSVDNPAVEEFYTHMIGPSYGTGNAHGASSKGLITGYAYHRSRPASIDPNVPNQTIAWPNKLFDLHTELNPEIRSELQEDNVSPPYLLAEEQSAYEYYPGGAFNADALTNFGEDILSCRNLNPTGASQPSFDNTGSLQAPCGLIGFEVIGEPAGNLTYITLSIEVAAGTYKGVMARKMQDVN